MASDTQTNGQGTNRIAEHSREGAEPPSETRRRSRSNKESVKDVTARMSGPYAEPTRLCLYVPKHIVSRLEAHAVAMGKSRDVFAAECLNKYMAATYSKRDELLRNAYGVPDQPPGEQPTGTPQEE